MKGSVWYLACREVCGIKCALPSVNTTEDSRVWLERALIGQGDKPSGRGGRRAVTPTLLREGIKRQRAVLMRTFQFNIGMTSNKDTKVFLKSCRYFHVLFIIY